MPYNFSIYLTDDSREIADAIKMWDAFGGKKTELFRMILKREKDFILEKVAEKAKEVTDEEGDFNSILQIYNKITDMYYEQWKTYRENQGQRYEESKALEWIEKRASRLNRPPEIMLQEFEMRYENEENGNSN